MPAPQVPEIHRDRRVAESFGGDAERYDRARPGYPDAGGLRAGRPDVDAVIAGTAWHWVDPVAGTAKAAWVLRPGDLLPPDKLAVVLAGVGAAIDAMGGSFTMPYTTVGVTAKTGQSA